MTAVCPKCDAPVSPGARRCNGCGLAVALAAFRPGRGPEGAPLQDPLLQRFERREVVRHCPDCGGEFAEGIHFCRRCERAAVRALRPDFERFLDECPIAAWARLVEPGPAPRPLDLVRVHLAASFEEAEAVAADLRFLSLETWLGSDAADPFPEWWQIGVWVRRHDQDAALFALGGDRSAQFLETFENDLPAARRRVEGLLAIGKYKAAIAEAERWFGPSEERAMAKARALILSARPREAERHLLAAVAEAPPGATTGRLRAELGIVHCLGNDGSAFGSGSKVAAGDAALTTAVAEAPRLLRGWKALIEVKVAQGDRDGLRRASRSLERLNPNLLARDGFFRWHRDHPLAPKPSWI